HGVGFAARRTAALGTSDFGKKLAFGERRTAFAGKWNVFRERYRQLTLRHRHRTAAIAIDNGYWRAPIALTRHAPIAQTIANRLLPPPLFLGGSCDFLLAHRIRQA